MPRAAREVQCSVRNRTRVFHSFASKAGWWAARMLATIDQRSTRVGKADAARWLPSAINQLSQLSQGLPDRDRAARGQRICAIFLSDTRARGRVPTNGTGTLHGFAVSDGDTVKFGKQRVRLFGIDAPEKLQPCDGGHWYPGPLATKALVAFIAGVPCRVTRSIMTTRTTAQSLSALPARTTSRR